MPIRRFSSLHERLDKSFLAEHLKGARSYRRIAGYFRSSIFELVGEEIAGIPDVRILCNSELDVHDINVAQEASRNVALKEKWNQVPVEVEGLLHKHRYRALYDLLMAGNLKIQVVPKDSVFVHGKAGVIEGADGKRIAFLGSINESKSAFLTNYEILWEDDSPEGVAWVDREFDELWKRSYPLPQAIIEEIGRVANRTEVRFEDLEDADIPASALVEAPIYRGGEQLQPWQRSFVTLFQKHRDMYGKVRLLLADEVGLGKTLSLATAAMVANLMGDGPVLILCPATLVWQWQVELKDRLGIPSCVWESSKKVWVDPEGRVIPTKGAEDIAKCPFQVAIVSTGLIFQSSRAREPEVLLQRRGGYGTVVLDEAHKARKRGGLGQRDAEPNNLLEFMLRIGEKTRHLLLGTATPIQTNVEELWDLMEILSVKAEFVLGRETPSYWRRMDFALPLIKGESVPESALEAWDLLRNPLPPIQETCEPAAMIRTLLELEDSRFFVPTGYHQLDPTVQMQVDQAMEPGFFREHNPLLRHVVLRKRARLEDLGLLERIRVDVHPDPELGPGAYPGIPFAVEGQGLLTNQPFNLAYRAAEEFTRLLASKVKSAGFMKSLMLQRICSSFASGLSTARKIMAKAILGDSEDESQSMSAVYDAIGEEELAQLQIIVDELSRPEARDPKLGAVKHFLLEHRSAFDDTLAQPHNWLEYGCIIFSQYYDTALWVAKELARVLPDEPVGVYAGSEKSGIYRNDDFSSVERHQLKLAVKDRSIRLMVATDAACEGLNLQTLGTLINVDLPWNPSRLEQRLGRIKRFGQARRSVDMLNLVYHDTQDQKVYSVISQRLKDKFDIFGSLPDTIDDEWIADEQTLEERLNQYLHLRDQAKNAFELRYEDDVDPEKNRWELCSRVLSRKDIEERMAKSW
ncbi:MAG: phospholipase D-like domain-containing anti-phage protein [Spirochaetales bacterium]